MNKTKGLIYAIISSATFGLIPLFSLPVLKEGIGVNSVLFYRFAISTLIMAVVLLIKGRGFGEFKTSPGNFKILAILSAFYGITAILLTSSYLYIPSGVATTIHFLYPVLVAILMIVFFKEGVSKMLLFAICLAVLGVYGLSSGGDSGSFDMRGIMLVLITVVTYSLYIVGVNKSSVSQKMSDLTLTFYVLLLGTCLFGLNLFFRNEPLRINMSLSAAVNLFFLALLPTVVSGFALIRAIRNVGSTITAVLGCMEPLTAVIVGLTVFGEKLTLSQFIGIALILVSVILVIINNNKKVKSAILTYPKKKYKELIREYAVNFKEHDSDG